MFKNLDQCPHPNCPAGGVPQDQRMIMNRLLAMLTENSDQYNAARKIRLEASARAKLQDVRFRCDLLSQYIPNGEVGLERWCQLKESIHNLGDGVDVIFNDPIRSEKLLKLIAEREQPVLD